MDIKRGDIILANLSNSIGSVQSGNIRAVLIIQNNQGNKFAPTSICVPFTTKSDKRSLPTHVNVNKSEFNNLDYDSTLICEQVITIDKKQMIRKVGELETFYGVRIDKAIKISLGLK